ncbi:hypothetical protein [Methylobacterium radiotolerans]|uniref:hypothetical protein n=1 Tax=Methylobacterium radiotolerans TaxID=31998 RepID=UPI001F1A36A7|nr:hypothetical protein [Methylobacterium radiotolerans]UIY43653.1 hypothetical protein LZ599_08150 [Methylobacterium radiotolerans]
MSPRPTRRRRRRARWAAAGLALLALASALPVAAIEGGCAAAPDPALQGRAGSGSRFGIAPDGYKRAAGDSYLTFPEWAIVHAYADLAGVTRSASESAFDYGAATAGFWTSLCGATRAAGRTGDVTAGQKVTNYVIGLSFTAEMLIQGAYERTVGALTARWRGPEPADEDRFNARLLADYAAFLRQTPWYRYPFDAELARLWHEVPFTPSLRAVERRGALTLQYGVKWAYARGIAWLAGMDPAGLTIRSVVAGLDAADATTDPRIAFLGPVPAGDGGPAALMETPRYRAFTEIVRGLGARGRTVLEIAGNRRILTTVLLPPGRAVTLAGAEPLFAMPIQSEPGWQRVGYDTAVEQLVAQIRAVEAAGGRFEHAYDY